MKRKKPKSITYRLPLSELIEKFGPKCFKGHDRSERDAVRTNNGVRCSSCAAEYSKMYSMKNRQMIIEKARERYKRTYVKKGRKVLTEEQLIAEIKERMMKTRQIDENGCWNHTGVTGKNGYCYISFKDKSVLKHRLSYSLFVGELSPGMDICHKCDNRRCFNPDHLFQGTRKENVDDCFSKNRGFHQKRDLRFCKNGHDMDKFGYYKRVNKTGWIGRQCKTCHKNYSAKRKSNSTSGVHSEP